MSSIKISELNVISSVSPDDFFPIVDSGSMTTYRSDLSTLGTYLELSGSVLSASNADTASIALNAITASHALFANTASIALNAITASHALRYQKWYSIDIVPPTELTKSVHVCDLITSYSSRTFFVSLSGREGNTTSVAKTYIISSGTITSGSHTGWFNVRPLSSFVDYDLSMTGSNGDLDLEFSQSSLTNCHFRVRRSKVSVNSPNTAADGEVLIIPLLKRNDVTGFYYGESVDTTLTNTYYTSSNNLPSWQSSFIDIGSLYKVVVVSGSLYVENEIRGNLQGTASNASTASFVTASNVHGTVTSASYAITASMSLNNLLPVGTIIDFAGTSVPDSTWLFCNGQEVSQSTYPTLYSVIGTTWGNGNGSTTFNLPDLRKRMTIGSRAGMETNSKISASVGNRGGGEAYNYHYHIIGSGNNFISHYNNDAQMIALGQHRSVSGLADSWLPPRRNSLISDWYIKHPSFTLPGDAEGSWFGNYFSTGSMKELVSNNGTSVNTTYDHLLGTSYALNDTSSNWYSGSSEWTTEQHINSSSLDRTDLSMPYAVVSKLIKVS